MGLPTNIADAAAAIKDGELGLFEEVSIGDLVVSALTGLSGSEEMEITARPVEAGFEATDASIKKPIELIMSIALTNPDFSVEAGITAALNGSVSQFTETWRDKRDKLYGLMDNHEILEVTTHEKSYSNMLIQRITPEYDVEENWNAFVAEVRLVEYMVQSTDETLLDQALGAIKDVGGL